MPPVAPRRTRDEPPAAELEWPGVLAWRAARGHLATRAEGSERLGVVARVAGLHAQLAASAALALWARVEELRFGEVDTALWRERTLVKTWAMRGTLHLLPGAELPIWVAALGELRPRHHVPTWLRHHGLTREGAEAMLAAVAETLLAGAPVTREELAREVAERTGDPALEAKLLGGFGDLLKPAAFRGELCFAPGEGQRVRFTHPRRWLGEPAVAVEPAAAVAEVTRRYLGAYGPATREAFARWFGMTSPAQAERWLRGLGDEVVRVTLGGAPAWALAAHLPAVATAEPEGHVRLLPAFDPFVVAAPRDADAFLPAVHRPAVYRPQGWLSPVVAIDGRPAGTWSHEHLRGRLRVTVRPFAAPDAALRRGVNAEAERLAAHLGAPAEVRWTEG